jgi:ubiquinone/menaquinone biosynthesis C-methylase UbiE
MKSIIDDVHSYWNSRPCNIRHSSKSQDSVEFFDEVAAKKFKAEDHKLEFLDLQRWNGKHILELGCGMGTDAIQFAKAGAIVTCIDLTENSLDLCKKNFALHGLQAEFFLGNIEELDSILPKDYAAKYDLIYSFGVIHHTPNPKKVFEKIPYFLNPNGEVRCMLYSRFSYKLFWLMKEYNEWSFSDADSLVQNYSEAQSGCPMTYTYTFDEIKDLISPYLEIQSIWKDHIFMWDIENYKKNIFIRDTPFQSVSDEYLTKMKKELGWHTMFIAKLNTV